MTATSFEYNVGDLAPNNKKAMASITDFCFVCGRSLGKNPLYFEVDNGWEIITPNSNEKSSQGCFPIGASCANKFAPNLLIKLGA